MTLTIVPGNSQKHNKVSHLHPQFLKMEQALTEAKTLRYKIE